MDERYIRQLRQEAEALYHTLVTRSMRGDTKAARLKVAALRRYMRRKTVEHILSMPRVRVIHEARYGKRRFQRRGKAA